MSLVNARIKRINADWARAGSPAGTFAESVPKIMAGTDVAIAASGVEHAVDIALEAGDIVTSITFVTAGTAANGPTAGYACLRDADGALLAQTADFEDTARAANTAYTVALETPYQVTETAVYMIGISFTASSAVPSLRGATMTNAAVSGVGRATARTHGSAVGATAPATVETPTTVATAPYYLVS